MLRPGSVAARERLASPSINFPSATRSSPLRLVQLRPASRGGCRRPAPARPGFVQPPKLSEHAAQAAFNFRRQRVQFARPYESRQSSVVRVFPAAPGGAEVVVRHPAVGVLLQRVKPKRLKITVRRGTGPRSAMPSVARSRPRQHRECSGRSTRTDADNRHAAAAKAASRRWRGTGSDRRRTKSGRGRR